MTTTPLRTVRSTLHEQAADCLRTMAARADAGEIVAVTIVYEYADGCYGITRSPTLSRLQTMGALLDAAIMRAQE